MQNLNKAKAEILNELNKVTEGEKSAFEIAAAVRSLSDFLKEISEELKEYLLDDLVDGQPFTVGGFKISKKNGATRWDYSKISKLVEMSKKYKAPLVDSDTGEVIEAATPIFAPETIVFSKIK
jgi:hypothetical protein